MVGTNVIVKLNRYQNGENQEITVTIDEQGNITARVEGVAGPACKDVSAFLKEMGEVTVDEETSDFYKQPVVDTTYQIGGY